MKTRLSPFGATLIMPGCAVASRAEIHADRPVEGQTALLQPDHVVDEVPYLFQAVRAQQERGRSRAFADHPVEDLARGRVQARGRLVENEQRRLRRQRQGDEQLLLHAARERAERLAGNGIDVQAQPRRQLRHPATR